MTVLDLSRRQKVDPRALPQQVAQHAASAGGSLEGRGPPSPSWRAARGSEARPAAALPWHDPAADYNRPRGRATRVAAREQAQWLDEAFRRAGHHVRRRAHADVPAPALQWPQAEWDALRTAGRRLIGDRGPRRAPRLRRGRGRLLRLPGHAGGGGAAGCASTPDRRTSCSRGWTRSWAADGPRFIRDQQRRPAGFGYGTAWRRCSRTCPLFRAFAETRRCPATTPSLPALVEAPSSGPGGRREDRRRRAPSSPSPDWADVKTRADQEIVCARFGGGRVRLRAGRSARAMEISGGRLVANGRPVDLVYRRAVLTEIVEREGQMHAVPRGLPRRARRSS